MRPLAVFCFLICSTIAQAGISGFGSRAMTAQEISQAKRDYFKGYELPKFWNAKDAKEWAKKTPYADQWRRLLKHQMATLEKSKEIAIDETYTQHRIWVYQTAYAVMLEKRPPKDVGATFYAGSAPVK